MRVHKIYLFIIALLIITIGCSPKKIAIPEKIIGVTFKQDTKLDYIILENLTDSKLYNVEVTIYNFNNSNNNFNNVNTIPPENIIMKRNFDLKPKAKDKPMLFFRKNALSKNSSIIFKGNYKMDSPVTKFVVDSPLAEYKK